jgi:hypothetical protein
MKLSDVRPSRRDAADRIVIYGTEGVGKSTFAASAPAPVFVAAEDGIRHLDVPAFPEPRTFDDVLAAVAALNGEHQYKTLVIDSLDWVEPMIHAALCKARGWQDIEAPGYGKGYVAAAEEWRRLLIALDLVRARGVGIVLIAHAQIKPFNNPAGPDYSRFELKLAKQAAALVREWSDALLFAAHDDRVTKDGKGYSAGQRVIHTVHSAAYDAKCRAQVPPVLPLEWSAYAAARDAGGYPAALLAECQALVRCVPAEHPRRAAAVQFIESNSANARALARALNTLRGLVPAEGIAP